MADWSENAKIVLEARYLERDKNGVIIETPDEMLKRVADAISLAEKKKDRREWKDKFLSIMDTLEFLPNSPTLINAGRELGQLSACFVLPIFDSMDSIFEMVKQSALIHKSGGGTGFNFSSLRPQGMPVRSTHGVASGPVSFMRAFNVVTDIVRQGGVRRGANIGLLNCTHPDIMQFINCKKEGDFKNFNISVGFTGSFLAKLKGNVDVQLHFRGYPYKDKIPAREIFENICHNAWYNGEPGVLFFDRINEVNPTPWLGNIWCVNPCGEANLYPFESCNLGSLDVSKFVGDDGEIKWDRLQEVVQIAVRFLDNVIDVNKYPRIQIERATRRTRKIGLGIMGWADLLGKKNVEYDSEEALGYVHQVAGFIFQTALKESEKLGKERGDCFKKLGRRNTCLITLAPTGTLSILAGCSSGIEPYFSRNYSRSVLNGRKLEFGTEYKVKTALEISPENHVRVQAAFQKHCDQAISKTINLREDSTVEDVEKVILLAHELGCKGVTVYRQGKEEAPYQELSECRDDKCLI